MSLKDNIKQDLSSIICIAGTFIAIFLSIAITGRLTNFIDISSIILVIIGTTLLTISCFSFPEFLETISAISNSLLYKYYNLEDLVRTHIQISVYFRQMGIDKLINSQLIDDLGDKKFKDALININDGLKEQEILRLYNNEVEFLIRQNNTSISMLRKASEISPSLGLIGTIIGLVQMLTNLNNIDKLGPAMSVALLTTFYGAMLSYVFFFPLASKIDKITKEMIVVNNISLTTLKSIINKENPRSLELILNSYLRSDMKVKYFD